MEILNAYILDDELEAIALIRSRIAIMHQLHLVGTSTKPEKALHQIVDYHVELLFLDIQMEGMNGLDVLAALPPHVKVICISAYDHYGPQLSASDQVIGYLQKPVDQEGLRRMVQRAFRQKETRRPLTDLDDCFTIKMPGKGHHLFVELREIDYLEGDKNDTKIHCMGNCYLVPGSIGQYDKRLPAAHFLRVHKSFIIPIRRARQYKDGKLSILCTDGLRDIEIGAMYRERVQAVLLGRRGRPLNDEDRK